jgi:hypothetical protein
MNIEFKDQCSILGQFWIDFRDDEDLKDFVEYNDLGLPMAYFLAEDLVKPTALAEKYIQETFDLFLTAMELTDEELEGVDNLTALLDIAYEKKLDNPD